MGILKSAADLVYTIRFLKLLVTPFNETDAYKAGIIDENGNKNRNYDMSKLDNRNAYKQYYTTFHRLVYNVKRIMAKAPGGQSTVARYGAALALIKEHGDLKQPQLDKIDNETGIDRLDALLEDHAWFNIGDDLAPGVYRMKNESVLVDGEPLVSKGDKVRIVEGKNSAKHEIYGVKIYEAVHLKTNQPLYISTGEIMR